MILRRRTTYNLFWLILGILLSTSVVYAEGTKQVQPNGGNAGYLSIYNTYNNFALYNASPEERLHINICNAGEIIYFGFRQDDNDVNFRLRDPNGNIVVAETAVPTTGAGYIDTHNQAVIGPQQITGGVGGYNALSHTSTMTGDYYIEFSYPGRRSFSFFDITVADAANSTALDGRLWSQEWQFTVGSFTNTFDGTLFVYADDGIVTTIDFNGIQPYVFTISCNATGVVNTNTPNTDRQSVIGNSTYPQYKIFLNDPDINCFPTGTFGTLLNQPTVTGCGGTRCINVEVDQTGQAVVLLDLNGIVGFQEGTADVEIQYTVITGMNCVPWDGNDGFGNPVASGTIIDLQIDYLNGITHLPIYDVENHLQGYRVTLVRPAGPEPRLFWDDVANIPNGTQDLIGCLSPCHTWQWNNTNTDNSAADYGNRNTINTWWYANIIETDLDLTVIDLDVDANVSIVGKGDNNDTTLCADLPFIQLNGEVVGAPSGIWSTSGNGTFSSGGTDQKGIYNFGSDDFTNGSVRLTLTSVGGSCATESDFMDITLQPIPTVDAGGPYSSCSNDPTVTLGGSFTNAGGIEWSGGNGIFVPNRFTPNATYTPDTNEVNAGSVTLTLTTTNNGLCSAASSTTALVNILPQPEVITGNTLNVCSNAPEVSLNGVINNATGGTWTGGNGTFQNGNQPTDVYTPTQTEIDNGTLTLTLTSQGQAVECTAEDNDFVITFSTTPVADAGTIANVCENDTSISLNGTVLGTDTYFWSGGTGEFSDSLSLVTSYNFSAADITLGSIDFTLTAIDTLGCLNDVSTITSTFLSGPNVLANVSPLILCANNQDTTLTVNVSGAGGVQWTGNGGSFSPNTASTSVSYTASLAEINNGSTQLFVETTGNGACPPAFDTVEFVYLPEPQINILSNDISICENNPEANLTGVATFATSVEWLLGNGTFNAGRNTINNTYTPTSAEISNGSLTLILSADRQSCITEYDTINITIDESPIVDAGSPQTVCSNNPEVQLNGSVLIAPGGIWEGGNGSFSTSNTDLNTIYTPTTAEIANGSLMLFLRNQPYPTCNDVIDSVEITFSPSPSLEIGPGLEVCNNNAQANLSATINLATGVNWSTSGSGNFSNPNQLTSTYNPSNADRSNTTVEIYATSTGNSNCNPVSDTLILTIAPSPTISDFDNETVCLESPDVNYSITVTNASGIQWSGGSGTYTPNDTSLNLTYTPSISEIQNGIANLTVTTTGNGLCNGVQFTRTITIQPTPEVSAGSDLILCGNNLAIELNGSVQNTSNGAQWNTNGSGNFVDNTNMSTTYNASVNDTTNTPILIWLESRGNGACLPQYDTIEVNFVQEPIADIGTTNATYCSNQFPIQLNTSGSVGSWTGGNGTFNPSRDVLNPIYSPTNLELNNGSLTLTYTTNSIGPCLPVSDDITLELIDGPEALAGNDQIVCGNIGSISLSGLVNNTSGNLWTTSGSGSINTSPTDLIVNYQISANDLLSQDTSSINFVLATTGNTQCPEDFDTIIVKIAPLPYLEAGPDQTLCALNGVITLSGDSLNINEVTWSGGNGGSFTPNADAINPSYNVTTTDTIAGLITFLLTSQDNTICPSLTDTLNITLEPSPIINAGSDQTICADSTFIDLNAIVINASSGDWASSGTGNFSPNGVGLNTSYFFSINDSSNSPIQFSVSSTGNGSCPPVSDTLEVFITPTPTIVLSNDTTLCEDIDSIQIAAVISIATDVVWNSNGTGTFTSPNGLITNYLPSSNDIQNGVVTITGTTSNSGNCNEVTDIMIISFSPAPTIFAGLTQTVCANDDLITLNGTISVSNGSVWTTNGSGVINNPTGLSTSYTITAADTATGFVDFFLQSTDNGSCNSYFDTVRFNFQSEPSIIAEDDFTICADSLFIEVNSTITNSNGASWSTNGSGNFFPSSNLNTTNYSITDADTSNGTIQFIVNTTGSGVCPEITDTLVVTIDPTPIVNPGTGSIVCADLSTIQLNGRITHAGGGYWVTSGTGSFSPDSSSLNTSYLPSAIDTSLGQVTLTLISTDNGLCHAVRDTIVFEILPEPSLGAGPDLVICAEQLGVQVNSTISNSNSVLWTTSGSGVFGPNTSTENPMYFPSAADTTSGTVELTITTSGNSPCNEKVDNLIVTMLPGPTVDAGQDQTVCANSTGILLNGSTQNSSSSLWSTNGTGKFTPSANGLNASYVPNASDTANGSVVIYLDAFSANSCSTSQDSMNIIFEPLPSIDAGNNISICRDVDFVNLGGSVTNAPGVVWSTSGFGFFAPNNTSLPGQYLPDGNDTTLTFVTLTLTSTGTLCPSVSDNINLSFTPIPTVETGNEMTVCLGIDSVQITGFVTNANGGRWVTNGSGTFTDSLSLDTYYKPSALDSANGTVLLNLTSTGSNNCFDYSDTLRINFGIPFIDAGESFTACDSDFPITLDASGTNGEWVGGAGLFVPNRFSNTAQYTPIATEISAGSLELFRQSSNNGSCAPVVDSVTINFIPGPTLNAVSPASICDNENTTGLSTTITVATQVQWTSSGTGTFDDNTSLTPQYATSASDLLLDTLKLYVTTTDNGICNSVTDTVNLIIENAPSSFAGNDVEICADNPVVTLEGAITIAATSEWESLTGNGIFNPNNTQLATSYTLDATEVSNLTSTIILKTTDNGNCNQAIDTLVITVLPAPIVDAGSGGDLCPGDNQFSLIGSVTNAVGGRWASSGDGNFSPSDTSKNAIYSLGNSDVAPTAITLTYTSFGNGLCNAVSDDTILNFVPAPLAIAGGDQNICSSTNLITLTGQVQNAGGGRWISTGTGTFSPNDSSLNATYVPSTLDKVNRLFNLILITTDNGFCAPNNDANQITIIEAPSTIISAGLDIDVCSNTSSIELNGFFENADGVVWSTINGGGSFTPIDSTLEARYIPVPNDTLLGTVELVLRTYGNSTCGNTSDTANLNFIPSPTLSIGNNLSVCEDSLFVNLLAAYTGANGITWSTNGGGNFSPSRFEDSTFYLFGGNDLNNNGVNISATTISNGYCESISDELRITIESSASVNASDVTICETNETVTLNSFTSDGSTVSWSSNGSGSLIDPLTYNPIYTIGSTDPDNGIIGFTVSNISINSCPNTSENIILTFDREAIIEAGPIQDICENNSLILANGSGTNFDQVLWRSLGTGAFKTNPNNLTTSYQPGILDLTNGSVQLTINASNNSTCPGVFDTLNINFTSSPSVTLARGSICERENGVQLNAIISNASGGTWTSSSNGTFSTNTTDPNAIYFPTITELQTNSTTLTLSTNGNGNCKVVTKNIEIPVISLPIANAGTDQYTCTSEAVTLQATTQPDINYNWYNSGGTLLGSSNSLTVNPNTSTDYVLEAMNQEGCETYDTVNVFIFALPNLNLPDEFCFNDTLLLRSNPTNLPNVPGVFQWTRDEVYLIGENSPNHNVQQAGLHSVIYNYGNCAISDTSTVHAIPRISLIDILGCSEDFVTFNTNEINGATYTWFVDNTSILGTTDSTGYQLGSSIDSSFYRVEVLDSNNCLASDSAELVTIIKPVIVINDTNNCNGSFIELNGAPLNYTNLNDFTHNYIWRKDGVDINHNFDTLTVTQSGVYDVTLIIDQCISGDTATETFNPNPNTGLKPDFDFCSEVDTTVFLISNPAFSYLWLPTGDTTQVLPVTSQGQYTLTVTNEFGCTDTDSIFITDVCPPRIFVPDAFTPNRPGENEQFYIKGKHFVSYEIRIYNRWGEVIFYSDDPNLSWDGTYLDEFMPIGSYAYIIWYEGIGKYSGIQIIEGKVTLVR